MIQELIEVDSLQTQDLEPYLTLRRPQDHQQQGIFIAEGSKVVLRLLESQHEIISILLTPEWFQQCETLLQQHKSSIKVLRGEKSLLEKIVGHHLHQGIMALAKIPQSIDEKEIPQKFSSPYFFVVVDGIVSAENMGVIVRNCVAFGVQALIVGETSCDPYLRRSVRNSMGTIFHLPIIYSQNLVTTIRYCNSLHIHTIATSLSDKSKEITELDFSKNCCIIVGNEGYGISKSVLEVCKTQAIIPIQKNVDSLNVGSATAIFLYEVMKQRKNI